MTLYMETTQISAEQTVGEIQRVLGRYGAKSIQVEYTGGEVSGVAFIVEIEGQRVPFVLPCRWKAVHKMMLDRMKRVRESRVGEYEAQAKRVAWRQILRWVEAQLALVQTKMVRIEEVFLPYMVIGQGGRTLFQKLEDSKFLLEAPK